MAENMFDGFDHTQYKDEVEERWGRKAYADSDRWWRGMSADEKKAWQQRVSDLGRDWVAAAESGVDPDSAEAQAIAKRHVEWLTGIPGTPAADPGGDVKGYVIGLGEMYVADDRFGARNVIVAALIGLIAMGIFVFALHDVGTIVFWVGGLLLSAFVGPAQAASRSLLARATPPGMQGEIFGLYATTGRVASFISPALWTLFIAIFGSTIYGVLGIVVVLALGLVLLLFVKLPKVQRVS